MNEDRPTDEAHTITRYVADFRTRFPDARPIPNLDNLAGARMYVRDANRIARTLGPRPATILDWGCGYGHLAWLLANRGYAVTAAEFFRDDHNNLGLLNHAGITTHQLSDPEKIALPSGSFDAIVSSGTLEHVSSIHGSMRELGRLLRGKGYFFVFRFPNERSYIEWYARRTGRWYHTIRMHPSELRFLMKMHCLEVLNIGYSTFLPVNCTCASLRWLRPVREQFDPFFTMLDNILVRIPFLATFSTAIWLIARKGK
jgi:SAM-dependent methyltransferase